MTLLDYEPLVIPFFLSSLYELIISLIILFATNLAETDVVL